MSNYVSKEELEEFFEGITITVAGRTRAEAVRDVLKAVYNGVMELPTTDALPVRLGKWISVNNLIEGKVICSDCRKVYDWDTEAQYFDYCPKCGARMVEE